MDTTQTVLNDPEIQRQLATLVTPDMQRDINFWNEHAGEASMKNSQNDRFNKRISPIIIAIGFISLLAYIIAQILR